MDESLHYLMDWELWLRFFAHAPAPFLSEKVLSGYRFHDIAKCNNKDNKGAVIQEEIRIHEQIQSVTVDHPLSIYQPASQTRLAKLRNPS